MSDLLPLSTLLEGYKAAALVTIGTTHGWFKHGVTKAEMVRRLSTHLAAAEHVRACAARLDPAAREVLTLLQHLGGAADAESLKETLLDDGTVAPLARVNTYFSTYRPGVPASKGKDFQDVMARLEVCGLVLGHEPLNGSASVTDFGLSEAYVVPREVFAHLPPPPSIAAARPPTFEREVPGDGAAFGRQLYLTWSYLWRQKPRLLSAGWLSKKDLGALAAQLDPKPSLAKVNREDGLPYLHFQRRLLEALGLVDWPDHGACRADEPGARRLWALSLEARVGRMLAAWQRMAGWNELAQLPAVRWTTANGAERHHVPPALSSARTLIAARVAELGGAGEWVGIRAVAQVLRRTARDFLVQTDKRRRTSSGYYDYAYQRSYAHRYSRWGNANDWGFDPVASDSQGWERVETEVIRQTVQALHWLGVCDAGIDAEGRVVAFRLTALGRAVLGAAAPATSAIAAGAAAGSASGGGAADPAHGARIIVQPNFHVMAIGPVSESVLMRLERFADRLGTDRVLEYELTRASVYRGQLDGQDGASIIATLIELSGAPVAQNVVRSIEDWQRLHEQIVVHRRMSLVQTADAALMAQLPPPPALAAAPGSQTLSRILEPARVAERFEALGLSPAARHDPDATGSIALAEDGTVQPRHKVPSLYLLGRLQRLADWDPAAGRWRLTAASAARALEVHGLDAPAQLRAWTVLCAGEPPNGLDRRLKAWCGHYPPAKIHRFTMLELPNAESLADLLADPRAASIVRRFTPAGPLLEVDERDIAALGEVLAEYGIGLGQGEA